MDTGYIHVYNEEYVHQLISMHIKFVLQIIPKIVSCGLLLVLYSMVSYASPPNHASLLVQGFRPEDSGLVQSVSESLPWKTQSKDDRVLLASVNDLYKRGNPDDILLLCLKLINGYFASVALLQNLRASVRPHSILKNRRHTC